MEFWNSFNVCNDNNNLLIKEIKSVGGILAIYKYVVASKCLRVSNEFISNNTPSVLNTSQDKSIRFRFFEMNVMKKKLQKLLNHSGSV